MFSPYLFHVKMEKLINWVLNIWENKKLLPEQEVFGIFQSEGHSTFLVGTFQLPALFSTLVLSTKTQSGCLKYLRIKVESLMFYDLSSDNPWGVLNKNFIFDFSDNWF